MRTSLDFPDPLFRHLKSRAAMEGRTLRDLVIGLIETGLTTAPAASMATTAVSLPSIALGGPMALDKARFTNADLAELADMADAADQAN